MNKMKYLLTASLVAQSLLTTPVLIQANTFIPTPATQANIQEAQNHQAEEPKQEEQPADQQQPAQDHGEQEQQPANPDEPKSESASESEAKEAASIPDSELLNTDLVIFSASRFDDKQSAKNYITEANKRPDVKGQIKFKTIKNNDKYYVLANYTKEATSDTHAIIYYVSLDSTDQEGANQLMEQYLLTMPDIFDKGELLLTDDKEYDIILRVRYEANIKNIDYNESTHEIRYDKHRPDFILLEDDVEKTKAAMDKQYPNRFTFEKSDSTGLSYYNVKDSVLAEKEPWYQAILDKLP